MKLKALLLSLSLLIPTSASAGYVNNGIHFMDGRDFNHPAAGEIIRELDRLQVPVLDGGKNNIDICHPQDEYYTMGYYVPSRNYIVICTNVTSKSEQMTTLTHEAVHVIQDLRTGINNSRMGQVSDQKYHYYVKSLSDHHVTIITELYDRSDWVLEAEAFGLQYFPHTVKHMLRKFVF